MNYTEHPGFKAADKRSGYEHADNKDTLRSFYSAEAAVITL